MTKIISFISRKGGTGKTTNAINLATYLSKKNNIILIETDPNYTINSLRKLELFKLKKKEDTFFPIVGSEDHRVAKEIKKLALQNQNLNDSIYNLIYFLYFRIFFRRMIRANRNFC